MKFHRHTYQENDEMRTHEWPQFVQDDVEHDDISECKRCRFKPCSALCFSLCRLLLRGIQIYFMMTYMLWMISFVYAAETAYNKKTQKCLTRHVQMVCSYMTSHRIYRTYCHWREE